MSYDDDDEPPSVCLVREPSVVSNRLWRRVGQARGALLPFRQNPACSKRQIAAGNLYDCPSHMAEKTWVDIEAFIEVFLKALEPACGRL